MKDRREWSRSTLRRMIKITRMLSHQARTPNKELDLHLSIHKVSRRLKVGKVSPKDLDQTLKWLTRLRAVKAFIKMEEAQLNKNNKRRPN